MKTRPTDTEIEQAESTLYSITLLLTNIQRLGNDALDGAGANETLAAQISSISEMAGLAGYHADLAITHLSGAPGSMGSEEWLHSPHYNALAKQAEVEATH